VVFEIFTDGAAYVHDAEFYSSSAYQLCIIGRTITAGSKFMVGETGNHAEIDGILSALEAFDQAIKKVDKEKVKPPYTINLFTDNLITKEALEYRIFQWVKDSKGGVMRTAKGEPVASHELYEEIYHRFLMNSKYNIHFLHLNSHCIDKKFFKQSIRRLKDCLVHGVPDKELLGKLHNELFSNSKFIKAKETFYRKNKMSISSLELLRLLVCNMEVDQLATEELDDGLLRRGIIRKSQKKGGIMDEKERYQKAE
jgi:ribonuclease HI